MNIAINIDCIEYMKSVCDNYFDLAVVDPPFGIGEDWKKKIGGRKFIDTSYKNNSIPTKEYFDELFRVSKNQIIWGYNYYTEILGPTNHIIIWDKMSSEKTSFNSMCEVAYNSFPTPARIMRVPWDGARRGNETGIKKIHPHQKPIALYKWIFEKYANKGDKILDTHLGSGTSRIVAYKMGFDFVGCEIDKQYFLLQEERYYNECTNLIL